MQLVIGNKNYSSWSMRPWVLLKQAGIAFDERQIRFDAFAPDSRFKTELARISPAGRVPVLIDGDLVVWDSLAIAEYLAERFPDKPLWPRDTKARARARSVCAEMHSGFDALRSHLPMNIEAALPAVGERVLAEQPAVRDDVARLFGMWSALLDAHGGPLLFGEFGIADAFFAPVVMRFRTYAIEVPRLAKDYCAAVEALPAVREWIEAAQKERKFVAEDEPYTRK